MNNLIVFYQQVLKDKWKQLIYSIIKNEGAHKMAWNRMKVILKDLLGNPNCNVQMRLVPIADLLLTFSTRFIPIRRFFFLIIINGIIEIFLVGTDKWKTPLQLVTMWGI